ncbi:MAG: FAD-dependent oxidoreductase [Synechococcaceae cyanobacterium ELA182]
MAERSEQSVDVVVWGGGSGGVAAALQAGRSGASTVLLTPGSWLGGMVSAAGVCAPDGNELTPWQSGLWGALLRALEQEEPEGLDQNWVSCFGYRPATAERILRRWLAAEASIQWWPDCSLREVVTQRDAITAVRVSRPGFSPGGSAESVASIATLHPRIVIDGSDRGELIGCSGAGFRFGWESREQWQEPSAPTQQRLDHEPFFRAQPVQSPTWVVMGQLSSDSPASDLVAAQAPPTPFAAATEAFGLEKTLTYGRLPGGLVMLNWPLQGNDWHEGLARAFPDALGEDRQRQAEAELNVAMQRHSLEFAGMLAELSGGWLQPGRAFPSAQEARNGALEGDQALALMPYWREGRRLVGETVVLEQHLLPQGDGACIAPLTLDEAGACTAIAVGNYANDHHYPGGDWPLAPKSCRWGGRWSGTPFTIPYGAIVSRDRVNLLAADKCLSVSHMANGATRLQPLVLNIGQAAGLAAALCCEAGLLPAELPPRRLQEALIHDSLAPAAPFPLWDTPWHHPQWRQRQLLVLDDPSRLSCSGQLALGGTLEPWQAPSQRGERLWQGELQPDGSGGFGLLVAGTIWPLITLEPALHQWLQAQDRPRAVALIGSANPWGPWLRISRLAEPGMVG